MEYLNHVLNIFRTHNIILYILFICSGVITFDFFELRKILGIHYLGQPYIAIAGLVFLICVASFAFLIVNSIFGNVFSRIKNYFSERTLRIEQEKNIEALADKEVVILLQYFIQDTDTVWLPMQGTEITSLVRKKLIFLSHNSGRGITNGMQIFHYSVYPGVKEKFVQKYPHFFGDDADVSAINSFIKKNTPRYIIEMHEMNRRWNLY